MERSLKASDSMIRQILIGPVLLGFVLGFLLVGALRLQPDQPVQAAADAAALPSPAGDTALRRPAYANATAKHLIIHPLV